MTTHVTRTSVRVYYEDTDFSGRVYHGSYVRFFERGRTEWLRERGLAQSELFRRGLSFVVTRLTLDFRAPAFIDDALVVATEIQEPQGPVLLFKQTVERAEAALATALASVVTIRGGRATRPPRDLLEALRGQSTPPIP